MAFGKKKKQKNSSQPSSVKVDIRNNPFYPRRTESLAKEVGSTIGVVAVCLLLAGVIITNCNYMAIASRQEENHDVAFEMATDDSVVEDTGEVAEFTLEAADLKEDEIAHQEIEQPGKVIVEETPAPEVSNGDYIIPDSNIRYISYADLEGLTQEELRIARNELYARHGRMFKDEALQAYFNSKSWYTGTIAPDDFTQEMLTDIERVNAATIANFEAGKGY